MIILKILSWTIRIFKYGRESGNFVIQPGTIVSQQRYLQTNYAIEATLNEKTTIYQYTK